MSLRQFLAIVRARFWFALLILLTTLALTAAWLALRTPLYTARAPLLVDSRGTDPIAGLQGGGNMVQESFIATQIDVIKSDRDERSGVPAPLWILLIVVLPVVGSIGWLVASRTARSRRSDGGTNGGGGGGIRPTPPTRGPRRPSGPVAPDDDPEFLWRLSQQQRRAQGDQSHGSSGDTPRGGTADGDTHDGGHDTSGPRTTP